MNDGVNIKRYVYQRQTYGRVEQVWASNQPSQLVLWVQCQTTDLATASKLGWANPENVNIIDN